MRKKRSKFKLIILIIALFIIFSYNNEYFSQVFPSISNYMDSIPGFSWDDLVSTDSPVSPSESSQVILSGPPGSSDLTDPLSPGGSSVLGGSLPSGGESGPLWYESLPPYSGEPWIYVNDGIPFFTEEDITTEVFEHYSDLDSLGRCGPAFANVCLETMPTEPRGNIGMIRPSGWHTVKYDIIKDLYLYNRGHLIGFQLTGENANENNLITCTRYLNVDGMLPWESQVAQYVQDTGNHVLYRVTPYFHGENLVASGVLMEAYSVEDAGAGVCFNVYGYNVQPGIVIDYATGDSHEDAILLAPGSGDHES